MKTWPMVRQLGFYFPEYRVVRATQIAVKTMPALAVLSAASLIHLGGWSSIPQALAMALFFLSLPLQGILWLGWRATHPLPLSLLDWGNQLSAKLIASGVSCRPLGVKACYFDLALILNTAFKRLDQSYWKNL